MKNDMFLQALGLARRAGKLCYGYDSVKAAVGLCAVFTAADLSKRSLKSIEYALEEKCVSATVLEYSMSQLGYAIGTKPVGIIGITDSGFANMLFKKLHREVTE